MLIRLSLVVAFVFLSGPAAATDRGWGRGFGHFVLHALPDPVNLQTGNFHLPVQDLFLPCYGFPLEIRRSYNSVNTSVGLLGRGWTFNYDARITITPGKTLTVVEPDGFINVYLPTDEQEIDKKEVSKILKAKRLEDKRYLGKEKEASYYSELKSRLETDADYFRRQHARYLGGKDEQKTGKFVSEQRSRTTIYRKKRGYERHATDGRVEFFDNDGYLTSVRDRNGNELTIRYDAQSRPRQVRDACGQYLKIFYDSNGRIVSISDNLLRTISYTYDADQQMTSSRGLDGKVTRYKYDDKLGKLATLVLPSGKQTRILYNRKDGRVREQRGPGAKITKFRYGSSGKGYLWGEAKDNQGGFARYEFYPKDYKTIHTSKSGVKTITKVSPCCGKPESITNPKGEGEFSDYDDFGNLLKKRSSEGLETKYSYYKKYNQVATVTTPSEVETRFRYDERGNLVYAANSIGRELVVSNNRRGKITTIRDDKKNVIAFEYNKVGKPTVIEKNVRKGRRERHIGEIRIRYQQTGDILEVSYEPKDVAVVKDIQETLLEHMRILSPAGITF